MWSDDYDPCYHKACDEVGNIDIENMIMLIKAIEKASQSLINGKDTPSRVTGD